MMSDVGHVPGVECKYCGAEYARPGNSDYALCFDCSKQASEGIQFDKGFFYEFIITERSFDAFLAKRTLKYYKLNMQGKQPKRCQAISGSGVNRFLYQCSHTASGWRAGHRVCGNHMRAKAPRYVSEFLQVAT